MNAPDLLIVVPARGGSKGLPRKNARSLGDLPLLDWTAQAVRRSGLQPAALLLSTDDDEIAAIGHSVGLEVPFVRPEELAGDTASAQSVALHALDWLRNARGIDAKFVMWLQPTSPFRPPSAVAAAYETLQGGTCDAVVGVIALHRTPDTLFRMSDDSLLHSLGRAGDAATRRQDVRSLYTPNGAMYGVRASVLRAENTFFPARSVGLVMDRIASVDIDDTTDWTMAEALARAGSTWRTE
jgi:CMP-N-acetylneuraminic acid synthetase